MSDALEQSSGISGALDGEQSFCEVFTRRAQLNPDEKVLRVVQFVKGEPIATPYTSADLLRAIKRSAASMVALEVGRGDRVLLAVSDPVSFFAFFVGAQCLGAIPVPAPSFAELQLSAYSSRIAAIARDARPVALILDDARAMDALPVEVLVGLRVLCAPHADLAAPDAPETPADFQPSRAPDEVAFLQYTSGSTGAPKGVVVLQRNLVANLRAIIAGGEMGTADIVFSWLPLFHDMGLVAGLLLGPYLGIPTYVASPKSFVVRPQAWLYAITRFRATFSAGPNFAFNALANRIPDRALHGIDLASWRLAFDGAELVDVGTFRDFTRRFAKYGFLEESFRPAYGLAEATLAVAFRRGGRSPRFDSVDRTALMDEGVARPRAQEAINSVVHTSVGSAVPGHVVRIRDPKSGRSLPDRSVGEIVVIGPSVTPGYFRELSEGARPRKELRTGDLGYLADGDLFVVDRMKDVLIVAGRKYFPSDLECIVGAIPGVRAGAVVAFSTRGSRGTEDVCLVVGLDPAGVKMKESMRELVQDAVFEHFGLTVREVLLVRPGDLPRTSSGKVQRSRCRSRVEAGDFRQSEEQG